jgi:hypothetical protein
MALSSDLLGMPLWPRGNPRAERRRGFAPPRRHAWFGYGRSRGSVESGVPTGVRDHTGSLFERSESEHPAFALRNYSTGCARKKSQASPVM